MCQEWAEMAADYTTISYPLFQAGYPDMHLLHTALAQQQVQSQEDPLLSAAISLAPRRLLAVSQHSLAVANLAPIGLGCPADYNLGK